MKMKAAHFILSAIGMFCSIASMAQEPDLMLVHSKYDETPILYDLSSIDSVSFVNSEYYYYTHPQYVSSKIIPSLLKYFCETNSHRGRYIPYYGTNTDCEVLKGFADSQGATYSLATYNAQPDNPYMNTFNNVYAEMLLGINKAANILKHIDEYCNTEDSVYRYYISEVKTIRAVMYLDLLKAFGDVPAIWEPMDEKDIYFLPRTDRDIVYKRLLKELKEIEDDTPWPNETVITTSVQRVSKSFVKGLRARIALYAGGYAYRADGVVRLSRDPELSRDKMYRIAYEECCDIINQGCNSLVQDYKDLFKLMSQRNISAGRELIWVIPMGGTSDFLIWGSLTRGRIVFTFGIKHSTSDQWTQQAQGGYVGPVATLWYDYDPQDVRRNVTCIPYIWNSESPSRKTLMSNNQWCFGKYRYEWMSSIVTSTNDDGLYWPYMRMADIYMMAAEAANELGNLEEAKTLLEPVLKRSLPAEKVEEILSGSSTHDLFFSTIVEQRKLEFAGEMLRKQDLIRWNLLKTKLDEERANLQLLAERQGKYANYASRVYYNEGLGADAYDADSYYISGLSDSGEGSESFDCRSYLFYITGYSSNDTKVQNYISNFYNKDIDPDQNMYWPIWSTFVEKSNGHITSYATEGYGDSSKYITEY